MELMEDQEMDTVHTYCRHNLCGWKLAVRNGYGVCALCGHVHGTRPERWYARMIREIRLAWHVFCEAI